MRWSSRCTRVRVVALATLLGTVLAVLPAAHAETYITGFEDLYAWFSGEPLAGQDGYFIPVAGSAEFFVYTYEGNTLGLPQNPTGELQFIGAEGPGGTVYARAQRDLSFADGDVYYLAYDFAAAFLGVAPASNNIGSFSVRDEASATTTYIHLMSWVDTATPTQFNAFFMGYDAAGTQHAQPGMSPGPEWENLELNHWYRCWARIDFVSNMFMEVGIIDLDTGMEATFTPADWYLAGGAAGGIRPTAFRFFAGGSVAGNVLAFDNIDIHPVPPSPVEETTWGAIKGLYK